MKLKQRLKAIVSTFQSQHPHRFADRSFDDIYNKSEDALRAGVFSFTLNTESDFANTLTKRATNSAVKLLLMARKQFEDSEITGEQIEDEELRLRDELIDFIRNGGLSPDVGTLRIVDIKYSSQADNPLAWILAELELEE